MSRYRSKKRKKNSLSERLERTTTSVNMRHAIWEFLNAPCIGKLNNTILKISLRSKPIWKNFAFYSFLLLAPLSFSCGVGINYSMTGTSTPAKTISIAEFYNNTDLGQANLG